MRVKDMHICPLSVDHEPLGQSVHRKGAPGEGERAGAIQNERNWLASRAVTALRQKTPRSVRLSGSPRTPWGNAACAGRSA